MIEWSSLREVLDIAARWIHVFAAILWVGNSMLWNWLDRNLVEPDTAADKKIGHIWLLHSGAFYYMEKTTLRGEKLPVPLHWFKWQAYTTWLSGAALLVIVYYASGAALLTGGAQAIDAPVAIAISVALIVLAWPVYEVVWGKLLGGSVLMSALTAVAALLGLTYGLTQIFSARAAFLHVGAIMATIMAANVKLRIVPAQRQLVQAVAAGQGADPVLSARAKARSIHNNYLTFPVIVLMVSAHFPALFGHRWNWLLLGVVVVAGALLRHFMNIRFTDPRWKLGFGITAAAVFVILVGALRTPARPEVSETAGAVTFADVRSVIDRRCASCHSAAPSDDQFRVAPGGVVFDTPEQIHALAPRIMQRAVVDRTMPLANKTKMTEAEREILRAWER